MSVGENLKRADPQGNLNSTQCGKHLYVGALDAVNIYDLGTRSRVLSIPAAAFAHRARCLLQQKQLLIVANQTLYLFNNAQPLAPVFLQHMGVDGPVIDFLVLE